MEKPGFYPFRHIEQEHSKRSLAVPFDVTKESAAGIFLSPPRHCVCSQLYKIFILYSFIDLLSELKGIHPTSGASLLLRTIFPTVYAIIGIDYTARSFSKFNHLSTAAHSKTGFGLFFDLRDDRMQHICPIRPV